MFVRGKPLLTRRLINHVRRVNKQLDISCRNTLHTSKFPDYTRNYAISLFGVFYISLISKVIYDSFSIP